MTATPQQMIDAGRLAPQGADAFQVAAFFAALAGNDEEHARQLARRDEQVAMGLDEVAMGELLLKPPAPTPGPGPGPTDLEVRNAKRVVVNCGGEWDAGSRVWPTTMGRPNGMRLGYLPMVNAYSLYKAKTPTPDVTWDRWVKAMVDYVPQMKGAPHEWVIGIPLWPHKAGSWAEAAAGKYREPWRRFWQAWLPLGAAAARHWLRPWEFTGDHYIFTVAEGVPYDGRARLDLAKCKAMGVATRIFLELGAEVLGAANVPRWDLNLAGGPAPDQLEGILLAAPPHDLVGSMSMDRYVQRGDSDNPDRWKGDLDRLRGLALELEAPWGISEGSFLFDKVSGGRQLGAPDSDGSVECLRLTDAAMEESIRRPELANVCRIILFDRCPNPEGHMCVMSQGARGTCTYGGTTHNRPIPVRTVDGHPTHAPKLFRETRARWGGPLEKAA